MKKKQIVILAVVLFVIFIVIFFIFNNSPKDLSSSQKEAALTKILGRKPNLTDNTGPKGDLLYKGKLISFLYPAKAKIYTKKLNGKALPQEAVESLIFDLDAPKIAFFMEVDSVVSSVQSVNDFPGVRLRQIESNIYKQNDIIADNQKGLVFEKQDNGGFEKTAFFYKNGKIYSFSFQGSDKISVEELYIKLMSTVNFLL